MNMNNNNNNNKNNNKLESSSGHDSHEDGLNKYYGCWQRIFINLIVITNINNRNNYLWDGFARFIWTLIRFFIIIIIIIVFGLICWSPMFDDKRQQLKQQLEQQYKHHVTYLNIIIIIIMIELVKRRIIIIKRTYAFFFKAIATILNLSYFWTPIAYLFNHVNLLLLLLTK